MAVTVIRSRIGAEDLNFGTGTFTRQIGESATQQLSQVYAGHVPIRDTKGLFEATNTEAALAEIKAMLNLLDLQIQALTS